MVNARAPSRMLACSAMAAVQVALSPSVAWSLCPNCLGQSSVVTPTLKLIGAFLLLPFVIAYVVFRAIRREHRRVPARNGPRA